jgi:hypothetical protein
MLTSMIMLAGQAYAAEQTTVMGGPGGAAFVDRPPAGARVGAVAIGAGALIDSVRVVYETPDGRRYPSARHGGPGGGPCVIALEPDERILAIRGRYGAYIESIQLITNKGTSRICGGPGGVAEYRIDVPRNHTVIGFTGRAGTYLDAIGLALAPRQPVASGTPTGPVTQAPVAQAPVAQAPVAQQAAALAEKVKVKRNLNDATLQIRLTAPASVQVALGVRKLRPKECFAASERVVSVKVNPPNTAHTIVFDRLQMNTDYSYAIRIGGTTWGTTCESGEFTTATKID